jgi:hypothetical protein
VARGRHREEAGRGVVTSTFLAAGEELGGDQLARAFWAGALAAAAAGLGCRPQQHEVRYCPAPPRELLPEAQGFSDP